MMSEEKGASTEVVTTVHEFNLYSRSPTTHEVVWLNVTPPSSSVPSPERKRKRQLPIFPEPIPQKSLSEKKRKTQDPWDVLEPVFAAMKPKKPKKPKKTPKKTRQKK